MTFLITEYYAVWNPTISNGNWFATQTIAGSSIGATETQNWYRYDSAAKNEVGPLTFVPGSTLGTQESGNLFGRYINVGVEIGAETVTLAYYQTPSNGSGILIPTTIAPVDPNEKTSFGIILGYPGSGSSYGTNSTLIANDIAFAKGVTIKNFYQQGKYGQPAIVGNGTLLVENTVTNDGVILNQGGGSIAIVTAPGGTFINRGAIQTQKYTTISLGNSGASSGIFNYSSIDAYGGEIIIGSSVYGSKTFGVGQTGTFAMGNAGTFVLNAPVNGSEYIQFTDGNGDRLGVNTNPTLISGATIGFHLPPIGGFANSVAGSPLSQSGNMITLNSNAIQGEVTGYSIVTGSNSQTLLVDETLPNGGKQTVALSFAGTTSLDHLTIVQTNGVTELISGGVDFFSGPTYATGTSANFLNPAYWDLGATPGGSFGVAINSLGAKTTISAPTIAEIAGASVYLSSTATSYAAPTTLSNMTIGLLGSVSNGVTTGGTLQLDSVNIGANSTIITGIGHNLLYASGSVTNFGTIEAAGTSAKDGVAIATGTGSTFTNAGLIEAVGGLDPATIGSYASPATTFINNGTLEANGTLTGTSPSNAGELVINDYITASSGSTGTILMTNGGIVELNAGAAANQSLVFGAQGGTLDLRTTADVAGGVLIPTITGFGYLSAIDLTGALYASAASDSIITGTVNTTMVVTETIGAGSYTSFSLVFAGHPQNLTFTNNTSVTLDGATQSAIVITAPCFAEGTRILTPRGEIPIEALRAEDQVLTIDRGTWRAAAIRWRGQRHVRLARHPAPERVAPIVIEPGALGDSTPHRRLVVSPDHALLLDGVLIEAKNLVNGVTIRQDFTYRAITYHHLELDRHSAILAEGAAAETYLESGNRHQFDGQSAFAMVADFAATRSLLRFAPLCGHGPLLAAIRRRLAAIAEAAGYRVMHANASTASGLLASGLIFEADGQRIEGEATGAGRVVFHAPTPFRQVRLQAPAGVPAEIDPAATDRRRLSLAFRGLQYGEQTVALDDACFATGFFAAEAGFRWAGPHATLDFSHLAPASRLTMLVHDVAPRWVAPQRQYRMKVA